MQPLKVFKQVIFGIDQDSTEQELKPGFFREIWNAHPKNGFSKTAIKNLKGTTLREHDISSPLAAGDNTCIGSFSDKKNNRLFYFLYNSNNDHSIWYFDCLENEHVLVMQTKFLNFSLDFPVTSCDFIEDTIQWVDNSNEPRSIIVSRAVAGDLYTFSDSNGFEAQCSLYKMAANVPPTLSARANDPSIDVNNISHDSFSFSTMFVYWDNTCSDVSPISQVSVADSFPATDNPNNKITITQSIDSDIKDVIKSIYFLFVKNGAGDFYLFREVEGTGASSYSIDFYNNDTVEIIQANSVNQIPNKAKNIIIHEQRSIVSMDTYDYDDEGNFTLTVSKTSRASNNKICAPNSSQVVAITFYDRFGRTAGPVQEKTVQFGNIKKPKGEFDISPTEQLNIAWSVSGTPPAYAKSFSVCVKKNSTFSTFFKCPALVMFYLKDADDTDDTFQIRDDGKIYGGKAPTSWQKNVHLKIPSNLPVVVTGEYKVRILNSLGQPASEDVQDIVQVIGDKLILSSNLGISNWATALGGASGPYGVINIALERPKTEPDKFFYECGRHYDCSDGTFSVTSGVIPGEYHYIDSKFYFTQFDAGNVEYGGALADTMQPSSVNSIIVQKTIAQTPTHSSVSIQNVTKNVKRPDETTTTDILDAIEGAIGAVFPTYYAAAKASNTDLLGNISDEIKGEGSETTITDVKQVYTPDLNRSCSDFGRAWIVVRNKRVNNEPTLLSISDPLISGTNINGLNKFRTLYTIPKNRTPITKIVNIGTSNIMLAVHERTCTSLSTYSGGNILHTTDNSQLLGDGRNIVGYEKELSGNFGSIFPDSIITHKGKAFMFDAFSGEVLRYANNGLTPIGSLYKMKNFFRTKGDQFIDPTGRNVIAGYDGNLDILYLTFKSTNAEEEVTVAFVDHEDNEKKRWFAFYDFLPERYGYINDRLFSFVDGELWEHNTNNTRNLFYGSQKTTRLTHIFNTDYGKEKIVRSVGLEGNAKFDAEITVPKLDKTDQLSHLYKSNFVRKDDMYYADLRRDENTLPAPAKPLLQGHILMGKTYQFDWENDSDEEVTLDSINYSYIESTGHRVV